MKFLIITGKLSIKLHIWNEFSTLLWRKYALLPSNSVLEYALLEEMLINVIFCLLPTTISLIYNGSRLVSADCYNKSCLSINMYLCRSSVHILGQIPYKYTRSEISMSLPHTFLPDFDHGSFCFLS